MMSDHQVAFLIPVDVTYRHRPGLTCTQWNLAPAKAASTIIKKQRQSATKRKLLGPQRACRCRSGDDVKMAIAIYVAQRHRIRTWTNSKGRRPTSESTAAVSECDRHIVVRTIDCRQVEFAIAVQVTHSQTVRMRMLPLLHHDGRIRRKRQSALAITNEHCDSVTVKTNESQIQVAVAIHVA